MGIYQFYAYPPFLFSRKRIKSNEENDETTLMDQQSLYYANYMSMMGAGAGAPMGSMNPMAHMDKMNGGGMNGGGNNSYAPPEDHNLNYYQEYCRLFIANVVLTTQMKELVNEKNDLLTKLAQLEVKTSQLSGSNSAFDQADDKKKRFRRTASEIDRHYRCPVEPCQKSYGSEGSLNQHLKLKHPEYQANTSGHSSQSALKGKGSKTKDEGGESTHQCVSS
eukprot:TRINITY_DN97_c0_g2_i4.p1 TRINITY_DN97_c0_g2~~TRINITY_DN97_c0_g2_i4.p1  ORF type:complete len:221 (-),score=39.39 TRINITY_DN97_c0_g2_i4:227-889(-)